MTASTATISPFDLWSEESAQRPDRRKIRARIGGLHCSLCTGTIEKALGRIPGVDKVAVSLIYLNLQGYLTLAAPWLAGALAFFLVFGVGRHILSMAFQALRRGILNQHVLLEIGAFAGIVGGIIGLILNRPGYLTAAFFAV